MNELCKQCDQPRKARHDRPGKFFTLCDDHYAEYQRIKNKESYQRHQDLRIKKAKKYREENPEAARESARRSQARPEYKLAKKRYMQTYRRPWREHVKGHCELCDFKAEDLCQLDVHHKDGDKTNNEISNLITLCPPCHRLAHKLNPTLK
jgi:hypothetical protein